MNVAIVGFGIEGKSAVHYWQDKGAAVTVCDQNEQADIPAGVQSQLGADYLQGLGRFDLIIRSAGIHQNILLADNPGIEGKISTIVNEFVAACPTRNIIGITGTKGKGTTSTLTAKMLEAAGHKVFLGGNIGVSPFEFIDKITPDDWVILELSSYQLSDFRQRIPLAACLMVEGEHLNWHESMGSYLDAKANLFKYQQPTDTAIYYADSENSHQIVRHSPGKKIPYYAAPGVYVDKGRIMIDNTEICKTSDLKLLGTHNWQNACAAATIVWQIAQLPDAIGTVLTSFTGLPHRLEFVRTLDGVDYYNDSFSSAPPAAIAALTAIPGTKVMILGGYDRMLPLDQLAAAIKEEAKNIRKLLVIGACAARLSEELQKSGYDNFLLSNAHTMAEVVTQARNLAKSGDSVVLSPGFPSFDMFTNFEERGLQFKKEVSAL